MYKQTWVRYGNVSRRLTPKLQIAVLARHWMCHTEADSISIAPEPCAWNTQPSTMQCMQSMLNRRRIAVIGTNKMAPSSMTAEAHIE